MISKKGKKYGNVALGTRLFSLFAITYLLAAFSQKIAHNRGCHAFHAQTILVGTMVRRRKPLTCLNMNFISDFFGSFQEKMNTGGSYNLGIDHDALEFPGPEVGTMAIAITRSKKEDKDLIYSASPSKPNLELATFAGGCFWGMELALQRCEGIEHTLVGYTQGSEIRPNYEQVSAGNTGHCEAVIVYFDPTRVSYEDILRNVFLSRVDITTVDGQGKDFGKQYRTGIYFHSPKQEEIARLLLKEEMAQNPKYGGKLALATEVLPAQAFWPAEGYHQRYLEKGGRFGMPQSAEKGNNDEIRCYG